MAKIFNNNNLVKVWDVRLSGRRLASISGKKGSGNNSSIKLKYDGWLRLSGATFQDGSVRKLFLGDLTVENIQIYTERFNLIFESPRELNELIFSFDDTTEYLVDLRQFQHLKILTGGVGLSVKGRNQELEKLTYFGDKGDYSRAGLNFKTGWYFKADGNGTGIATMRLTASEATKLQADGNVLFCDADGSNKTNTKNLLAGDNVVYFKCESEDGYIYLQNDKITKLGTESLNLFELPANAPIPYVQIGEIYNLLNIRIINIKTYLFGAPPSGVTHWYLDGSNIFWTYTGAPPSGVTYWYLVGSNIFWTYTGAPPSGVTYWKLEGSNINWTYTGAPPSGVTYWYLVGSNIFWTYEDAPPSGVTYWRLNGSNINWTYTGAPPSGVTFWYLNGSNIFWTYTGAPPSGVTHWHLDGSNIFWTYEGAPPSGVTYWHLNGSNINNINTNFLGNSNYMAFYLKDWRLEKIGDAEMGDDEMKEILNSLKNRVGALPSTIQIGDYLNYSEPPEAVIEAVNELKTAKDITTVTLSV